MNAQQTILAHAPGALAETEIQDFIAFVRAGGEVGGVVLEENVRNAECLVVVCKGSCWMGVGALKNPKISYRKTIHAKSGVAVDAQEFPFELGYLFVLPSARKQGIGLTLCDAALSAARGRGVFATARTNNDGMHVILPMCGFSKAGQPYASARGGHHLQLFLRHATQPPAAAAAPQAAHR